MERNLFRYIWSHTSREQVWIVIVTILAMIPYYMSFDLPKQIINGPITGIGFEDPGNKLPFMRFVVDLPYFGEVTLFPGIDLERMPLLVALSLAFLSLVIVNGLVKIYINTYKGRMGERLLRRIRFDLIDRVLRFPPKRFKSVKAGEVSSMVKDEVEPFGGFAGEAFASPVMLAGQALTAMLFIFIQHVGLGFVALVMALIQVLVVPRLRARLIVLGRQRQIRARELAGRVAEIVEGIDTIRGADATNYVRADIVDRLGKIFKIRYDIFQWKFFVKFLNNFIAQVTPFIFYLFGGYLAIRGTLDVGQLVAVINAYKELPDPMKGLIDYDLARQDVQVKYETIIGQFDVDQLIEPDIQKVDPETRSLAGKVLQIRSLNLTDDSGTSTLERASARFESGEAVAFLGTGGSGAENLAEAIGRLVWPASGAVQIGGQNILELPDSVTGRRVTYASPNEFFFSGTLGNNLLFGLKNAPREPGTSQEANETREWWRREAELAGNPTLDLTDNWIDELAIAKQTGTSSVDEAIRKVLGIVDMQEDVLQLGLRCPLDPEKDKELADTLLELRHSNKERLAAGGLEGYVLPFDVNEYNDASTVGENLFFGTPINEAAIAKIAEHDFMRNIGEDFALGRALYAAGRKIAETAVGILGSLPDDHPFFERMQLMRPEEIPEFRGILERTEGLELEDVEDEADAIRLMWVCAYYTEYYYRFGVITDEFKDLIVKCRHRVRAEIPDELKELIEFIDYDKYMYLADIRDNIAFGRPNPLILGGETRLEEYGDSLRDKYADIVRRVTDHGMSYDVGPAGRRLTASQRARLNVARALLRESDVYVFNRPLIGFGLQEQREIMGSVLEFLQAKENPPLVIWVLSNSDQATLFERVLTFEDTVLAADQPLSEFLSSAAARRPEATAPLAANDSEGVML